MKAGPSPSGWPGWALPAIGACFLALALVSNWPALNVAIGALALAIEVFRRPPESRRRLAPPQRGGWPPERAQLVPLLDALAAPTVLVDRRGNVTHANADAVRAFPALRDGAPLAFAIRAPEVLLALAAVQGGEVEAKASFSERQPVERHFDARLRRVRPSAATPLPGDRETFAVLSLVETTAERRIEAMRVDFVANASHELRTPLASIIGFAETLQGPAREDAGARERFLGIMLTQARRMARLVDDLLSLSKIELNAHIRPSDPVAIDSVVRQVGDALAGLARERGVRIVFAIGPGNWSVPGDRDELVRVFENLIENAIKYGHSGERVDVSLRESSDNEVEASIRDYGPGIAPEHLPRLTERFYRADVNESRVLGGTGLGLAIVKHIVTRHRGRLAIESEPGSGAVFRVFLPRRV